MKYYSRIILFILLLTLSAAAQETHQSGPEYYWGQWRGPLGTGVAPHANPPIEWSEAKNIRWKIALPGKGHSTPLAWGDRVYITTAIPYGEELPPKHSEASGAHDNLPVTHQYEFAVLAISRSSGKTIWQRTVHKALPHEYGHYTGSLASNSPVTDGEHLFAFFGSNGLYCLDMNGELLWQADLGQMQSKHGHGEASSPALYGNTLLINWDHEGQSFIVALEKNTGKERWKVLRDEVTSWTTPIIFEYDGKTQAIVSGTTRIRSYDLTDGSVIWECGGLSANIVASPVMADGMVFAGSSYEKRAMLAIHLDGARGDITGTDRVAWTRIHGTPYVPSPLLYGGYLYFLRHYQNILSRVDIKTGKDVGGPFRLNAIRNVYGSPVGAANRIYITDLDGTTLVFSHDPNPQVLALNRLEDSFSASAALAGNELYLRGAEFLYCISEK